jgi:flagellar export protein FliJ
MQSFHFRLARILDWRRTELAAEEARLAPLVAEWSRLEAARIEVAAARDRTRRDLLAAAALEGRDLVAHAAFRARLAKEQAALERQSAACRERMAGQRARIVDAHRRVRLLEKLRDRRREEWRALWDRELESFASEAYLARWSAGQRA